MPLGKLRKYVNAYNIKVGRVVEKDDLIDRIMMARGPNGCLSPECENDLPPATTQTPRRQATTEFARPDLAPDDPPPVPPRYQPPPGPPPGYRQPPTTPPRSQYYHQPPPVPPRPQAQPPPPNTNTRPWPGNNQPYANLSASRSSHNLHTSPNMASSSTPPRPRAASTSPENRVPSSPPPPPPPDLNELLSMTDDSIAALSIGSLKSILFRNHVVARGIIEKAELVKKVRDLVDNERRVRERAEIQRQMEEQAEQERIQQMIAEEERCRREQEGAQETGNGETASPSDDASVDADGDSKMEGAAKPIPKPTPSTTPSKAHISAFERNGLCVICQDEEANIAIVDCG
ncbi:hypothetical protein ONZ45_g4922 [Pleurotus djamor]|nr:hypothetical protein ONZ45_g4922 [Pleurotus djamor]